MAFFVEIALLQRTHASFLFRFLLLSFSASLLLLLSFCFLIRCKARKEEIRGLRMKRKESCRESWKESERKRKTNFTAKGAAKEEEKNATTNQRKTHPLHPASTAFEGLSRGSGP